MQREQLEVDVLFVGAGPASLAGALHLSRLIRDHNDAVAAGRKPGKQVEEPTILVIEKGKEVGAHALSGAVVDPGVFDELLGGLTTKRPPYDTPVRADSFIVLSEKRSFSLPVTPPPFRNHGNYVASLGRIVRWLADLCEENGVHVYPEFPGARLLFEGDAVVGVRIGDRGRDRGGRLKRNFEPGVDVRAKVTVLGEGPRGSLARQAEHRFQLSGGRHPQVYAIGVKEIWEVPSPPEAGLVWHTLGYPLGTRGFGGGFVYTMENGLVDLGYVVGLDQEDPYADGHRYFQMFKAHTLIRSLLKGGKVVGYGAKAIPEGGLYSMPRLFADGLLLVGDTGGFLNSQRLKGIHLAVKSGMLAAATILDALLAGDFSGSTLGRYEDRFRRSWAHAELRSVRNFRQAFQKGFWRGMLHAGAQFVSGGRGLWDPLPAEAGHRLMRRLRNYYGTEDAPSPAAEFDGKLTFDKLTDLYYSGTAHEEDQPSHLKILDPDICSGRCVREYGNPCRYFCPADVYEIVKENGRHRLQVNFSNCVHCKTCDIMDPYQVIVWTPPEGGGGPDYKNM